jgi:hypothetical protein
MSTLTIEILHVLGGTGLTTVLGELLRNKNIYSA